MNLPLLETTRYRKSITIPPENPIVSSGLFVLKSAKSNKKLGRGSTLIRKGPFRGMPLYSLTLIERETCPSDCPRWADCYGNSMPFAKRHSPGDKLLRTIEHDVNALAQKHPQGFVVRLHVLGDFFSAEYVSFWSLMLFTHSQLHVFGYTHRPHGSPIGDAISSMSVSFGGRCSMLRSDPTDPADPLPGAHSVLDGEQPREDVVICPEQTGRTESCLTCGLCMNSRTSVQFLAH